MKKLQKNVPRQKFALYAPQNEGMLIFSFNSAKSILSSAQKSKKTSKSNRNAIYNKKPKSRVIRTRAKKSTASNRSGADLSY